MGACVDRGRIHPHCRLCCMAMVSPEQNGQGSLDESQRFQESALQRSNGDHDAVLLVIFELSCLHDVLLPGLPRTLRHPDDVEVHTYWCGRDMHGLHDWLLAFARARGLHSVLQHIVRRCVLALVLGANSTRNDILGMGILRHDPLGLRC